MKILIIFGFLLLTLLPAAAPAADRETAYERVMRTGTIRCGYVVWPPIIEKEADGTISGIYHDYMLALGEAAGLEIEWTQELSLETYLEDLSTGRYDVECSGGWPSAKRARRGLYTNPIYYLSLQPFVKADETRFSTLADFNSEDVRLALWDGEYTDILADRHLPEAKRVRVPSSLPAAHVLLEITTGKADVAFVTEIFAAGFLKNNPDSIKAVPLDPPLQLFPQNLTVKPGEQDLKDFLNTATEELMLSGRIEKTLQKYEQKYGVDFVRTAKPYEVQK